MDIRSAEFRDKVNGCWMGKNCGGTLGTPLEEVWGREEPFDIWWYPRLQEGGIPNDDLEMQFVWLKALEEVGPQLTATHLSQYWLNHIGYNWDEYGLNKTNLKLGLIPPVSGNYNNWFKDCMGCPIRSEIWACVTPGAPRLAVQYAFQDAICDHAGGDSVYGEMFNAAVQSAAFVLSDPRKLIEIGLSYIPESSVTYRAVKAALDSKDAGEDWLTARKKVMAAAPHYVAQYSPANIGFQIVGWLWGNDFGDALCKTVNCGYDTDSSCASLGSSLGIVAGRSGIPTKWSEPLGEGISTNASWGGLQNAENGANPIPTTMDEATDRTVAMAERVMAYHGKLDIAHGAAIKEEDLYADDTSRALWAIPPVSATYPLINISVRVSYGDTPAVIPGERKPVRTEIINPNPVMVQARARLFAGEDWASESDFADVEIAPESSVNLTWNILAPDAGRLCNSNPLYLAVQCRNRPLDPAVPIVLLGAYRYNVSGPYTLEDASAQAMLDEQFPPELTCGMPTSAEYRSGDWETVYSRDNALPLREMFAEPGVCYVQTHLWAEQETEANIQPSVNCAVQVHVNGQMCAQSDKPRRLRPNYGNDSEITAKVKLRQGWNEVLLKLVRTADMEPFAGHLLIHHPHLQAGHTEILRTRAPWDE